MKAFSKMLKIEFKSSVRDMNMPIFAVIFPIIVAVILGLIYGGKPAFEGAEYTFFAQSFGAISSIGICAAGVMGLPLVLADYRNKKILKRFKVTPVSPAVILFVQVAVNFIMSVISLVLVYTISVTFFGYHIQGSITSFLGSYLLVLISIYSLGMLVAAVSPNTNTSNLLCCILYFPMLIFSGATLPYEVMPTTLQKVANIMPLTQGIKLLKGTSLGLPMDNILLPIIVMAALSVICIGISIRFFRWE